MNLVTRFIFTTSLIFIVGSVPALSAADTAAKIREIHVSVTGNDAAAGSAAAPLKTFAAAQKAARAARANNSGKPVTVLFHAGIYYLPATIVFDSADSGSKAAPVIYAAAAGEEAVISGGMRLELHWKAWRDGILTASVPAGLTLDQLFVDGKRQAMARYPNVDANVRHFNGHAADAFSPARAARWQNPVGGFIHAMHKHEWGDYHYRITGKGADNIVTYEGGWQNNRQMGMHDNFRMVENILEELDAPGEWFLDSKTATLYYMPAAGLDPATAVFEGVRLKHLVEFRGDQQKPVRFITLRGLTLRHAARTFMENKEPLLRSDWTTYRGGAISFIGGEDCAVQDCTLDQVGGNAVFVSGYNRRIAVTGCWIKQAGANGVAFVGDPSAVRSPLFEYNQSQTIDKLDLQPGPKNDNYPADCLVDDCLIHATGRVEKQTAPVQIAMAARITVRDCSIFDVPRAGINIGDGCWGGHLIEGCDVFDTVLETGDHGSFNSWGRDRFWVPNIQEVDKRVAAQPTLPLLDVVEPIILRNSRWRCDHGWDIDLDDGSSHFRLINNLCLGGGIKFREGYNRVLENNVMVNNSFHPHVWYQPSHDVVRRNIVFTPYQPIGMPKPWGDTCDTNLLHQPGQNTPTPATALQNQSGRDGGSLVADARFIAPEKGDYRVAEGSPALALGFVNFPMDRFGVRSLRLRVKARQPVLPGAHKATPQPDTAASSERDPAILNWLGARIKNLSNLGEVSATGMSGQTGVFLLDVDDLGFAATSGLRKMDVIRSVDGRTVTTVHDLLCAYASATPGKKLPLGLWRTQKEDSGAIAAGRSILLSAGKAEIRGEGARPGYDSNKDYLGSWHNEQASLAWKQDLPAGTWDIALLIAAPLGDAGSTYAITVGDAKVEGVVPDTGGWESFTARHVGQVVTSQTGTTTIVLRPLVKKGGAVMNLRGVVLTRR